MRVNLRKSACLQVTLVSLAGLSPVLAQETGEELYHTACAACHGGDGSGNSVSQLGFLDLVVPDFTDCDFAAREPDPDWYAVIHAGGPVRGFDQMMPSFGDALEPDQIQAILDHVRTQCTDDRWPRGEFNLPRALFTEKAYPEDEVVLTTWLEGGDRNTFIHEFLWEYRFGAQNQIEIALPFQVTNFGGEQGRQGGTGDLEIGLKRNLSYNMDTGNIYSVGAELIVPAGDDALGFGGGTYKFEPYFAYGKLLPADSFFQMQALLEFPSESGFEDEAELRALLGRTWTTGGPFGRAWTPMFEVIASRDLGGGADIQWDLVPQFQVTLNTRQHVMANFGLRIPTEDEPGRDTQFVFYLLWDWFDGGVLEGW